jgi:hypothetical protein
MPYTFNLPFYLRLPDGDYPVEVAKDDIVTLRLTKKIPDTYDERLAMRSLLANDLKDYDTVGALNIDDDYKGNRARKLSTSEIMNSDESLFIEYFQKDGVNYSPPMQLMLNNEIPYDEFGRFRYTKVTIFGNAKNDLIDLVLTAINKLITCYRMKTDDFWVRPVRKKELEVFFEETGRPAAYKALIKFLPDCDDTTVADIKKEVLGDVFEMPSHMLFLDAKNAYEQMNYALCVIYAVTSIEAIVKRFLTLYASHRGFTKEAMKSLMRTPIRSLVEVVLPLVTSNGDLAKELITDFIRVNSLRNDIIHEAETRIEQGEAKEAVGVAERFALSFYRKIGDLIQQRISNNKSTQP